MLRHPCMTVEWAPDFYTDLTLPLIVGSSLPLPALVNALVLRYQLDPDHDASSPIGALVDHIRTLCATGLVDSDVVIGKLSQEVAAEAKRRNINRAVSEQIVQYLLEMNKPTSVNPDLTTGTFPKSNLFSKVFDALGIDVRHAWCVDPIDADPSWNVDDADSGQDTYAMFVETVLAFRTIDRIQEFLDTESAGDAEIQQRQSLIRRWLDSNPPTRMSACGMHKLVRGLDEGAVAVLQLGEKYFTVYKHSEDKVYVLTIGARDQPPRTVWRPLALLATGDRTSCYDGSFMPVTNDTINDEREERIHKIIEASEKVTKRIAQTPIKKTNAPKKLHCSIC